MKTEIIIALDRSGSMNAMRQETIEGVIAFKEKQKEIKGKCRFSLVQFNDFIETTYRSVKLKEIERLNGAL